MVTPGRTPMFTRIAQPPPLKIATTFRTPILSAK